MGNTIIKDITSIIGSYLTIKQIIRMSLINKHIKDHIQSILWTHDIANLELLDLDSICCILNTYKFSKINLTNTCICDNFDIDLSNITQCILINCLGITDAFMEKLSNCVSIDLTNCMGVRGSFLKSKNKLLEIKLFGCYLVDKKNLTQITHNKFIDLSISLFTHDPTNDYLLEYLSDKCGIVYVCCASSKAKTNNNELLNIVFVDEPQHVLEIPKFIKICRTLDLDIAQSRIYKYIQDKCICFNRLNESIDGSMNLLKKNNESRKFLALLEDINESNILNNKLFFKQDRYIHSEEKMIPIPDGCTQTHQDFYSRLKSSDLLQHLSKPIIWGKDNNLQDRIITIGNYYYDLDCVNDMIRLALTPKKIILDCYKLSDSIPTINIACNIDSEKTEYSMMPLWKHNKKINPRKFDLYLERHKQIRLSDDKCMFDLTNPLLIKCKSCFKDNIEEKISKQKFDSTLSTQSAQRMLTQPITSARPTNPNPKTVVKPMPIDEFNSALEKLINSRK
jgi:hypothetical protein